MPRSNAPKPGRLCPGCGAPLSLRAATCRDCWNKEAQRQGPPLPVFNVNATKGREALPSYCPGVGVCDSHPQGAHHLVLDGNSLAQCWHCDHQRQCVPWTDMTEVEAHRKVIVARREKL